MIQVVEHIVPLFAIIGLGKTAVWARFFSTDAISGLNQFAYWIALPSLLFGSIVTLQAVEVVAVSAVYLAACLLMYGLPRWSPAEPGW